MFSDKIGKFFNNNIQDSINELKNMHKGFSLRNMRDSKNELFKLKNLVIMGMLSAIQFVLGKFTIDLGFIKIGVANIPVVISGALFGPYCGIVYGFVNNHINFFLNPSKNNRYFFGYVFTAMLAGYIHGAILYKNKPSFLTIVINQILITLICNITLNSIWTYMLMYGGNFEAFLPKLVIRISTNLIRLPINILILYLIVPRINKEIKHIVN